MGHPSRGQSQLKRMMLVPWIIPAKGKAEAHDAGSMDHPSQGQSQLMLMVLRTSQLISFVCSFSADAYDACSLGHPSQGQTQFMLMMLVLWAIQPRAQAAGAHDAGSMGHPSQGQSQLMVPWTIPAKGKAS